MQRVAHPPAQRRRRRRCQHQPASRLLGAHEVQQVAPQCLRVDRRIAHTASHSPRQRPLQRALLVDLPNGAADAVDVRCGHRPVMLDQPLEQVVTQVEAAAVREDAAQALARALHHLGQLRLGRAVAVAHEEQVGRQLGPRQPEDFEVRHRRVAQYREAREVQSLEGAERQHRIGRVGRARREGHGRQQLAQPCFASRGDGGDHHEVRLRSHCMRFCRQRKAH